MWPVSNNSWKWGSRRYIWNVAFNDLSEKVEVGDTDFTSFSCRTYHKDTTFHSSWPDLVKQVKDGLSSSHFDKFAEQSTRVYSQIWGNSCEAELDRLLESFGDTKVLDSSGYKPNHSFTKSQQACSTAPPQPLGHPITASLDVFHDLSQETSNVTNQSQDIKGFPGHSQSLSHTGTKAELAKLSQESSYYQFWWCSRWFITGLIKFDEPIAGCKGCYWWFSILFSLCYKKVLDDFDSWLNTIWTVP